MTQVTPGGRRRGRLIAAGLIAAATALLGMGVTPSTGRAALAAAPTTVLKWAGQQIPASVGGVGGTGVLSGVRSVAAYDATISVMADTSVMAWGPNSDGQLGDGTQINRPFPVPVHGVGAAPVLTNVAAVATGNGHSLALLRDSSVVAWGLDDQGQLGDRSTTTKLTPVRVHGVGATPLLTGVTAVAAGDRFSVALLSDGSLVAWGLNGYGQLGNGTNNSSQTPVPVKGLPGRIVAISAGFWHVLALTATGEVVGWGYDEFGEIGNGVSWQDHVTPIPTFNSPTPAVGLLSGVTAISAGFHFSLAIRADGSVVAWGDNLEDELGNGAAVVGDCSCVPVPAPVHGLTGSFTAVSAGGYDALALRGDGAVFSWGSGVGTICSALCIGQIPVRDPRSAPGALGTAGSGVTEIVAGLGFNLACIQCDATGSPLLPTISGITPPCGPVNASITISGANLEVATGVTVDGATTTFTAKADGTAITLQSPPHQAGLAALVVITPAGPLQAGTFKYQCSGGPPQPTVNYLDPPCGPTSGGTNVHITGTNFGLTPQVTFVGVPQPISVTVKLNGTELDFNSPPSQARTVPLLVTTAGGTVPAGNFTYPCPPGFGPSLAGIRPACGPTSGGPVTLTGSHLEDRMSVSFDGAAVPGTASFARNTISARAPRHAAGRVPVTVTGSSGQPTTPVTYE